MGKVNNERMALFYNESNSERNKQKIFLEIKEDVAIETKNIINFFVKQFSNNCEKTFDFEEYYQIANEVLLDIINQQQTKNDKYNLKAWYITRLKSVLAEIQRVKHKKIKRDMFTDFQNKNNNGLFYTDDTYFELESKLDENYLKDIIKLYGDKVKFRTKKTKMMFMLSLGFTKSKKSYSYERIAKRFNCTRQNVMQTCKRTLGSIKRMLEKDNKLEELRQFL